MSSNHQTPESPKGLAGFILSILQSPQKLVHWIVFALVAATLYQNYKSPEETAKVMAQAGDLSGTLYTKSAAAPLFPTTSSNLPIQEITKGKGVTARCGQTATFRYHAMDSAGKNILEEKIHTLTLGKASSPLEKNLQAMVIGSQIGALRQLAVSRQILQPEKPVEEGATLVMSLQSITPAFPENRALFRVYESSAGYGHSYACGESVQVKLTITQLDGQVLSLPQEGVLSFTLGSSTLPMGLEAALENMPTGSKRSILLPPTYQAALQPSTNTIVLPLPKDQSVIIDAEVLGDGALTPAVDTTTKP